MNPHNTKLNKRITWLLVSLTLLAYTAKTFIDSNSPYISWANSLVTVINLSILFSTNGFEKIFHNSLIKFILTILCSFFIFLFVCNILSSQCADLLLNLISFLSIAGAFIQNNKSNI